MGYARLPPCAGDWDSHLFFYLITTYNFCKRKGSHQRCCLFRSRRPACTGLPTPIVEELELTPEGESRACTLTTTECDGTSCVEDTSRREGLKRELVFPRVSAVANTERGTEVDKRLANEWVGVPVSDAQVLSGLGPLLDQYNLFDALAARLRLVQDEPEVVNAMRPVDGRTRLERLGPDDLGGDDARPPGSAAEDKSPATALVVEGLRARDVRECKKNDDGCKNLRENTVHGFLHPSDMLGLIALWYVLYHKKSSCQTDTFYSKYQYLQPKFIYKKGRTPPKIGNMRPGKPARSFSDLRRRRPPA